MLWVEPDCQFSPPFGLVTVMLSGGGCEDISKSPSLKS